MAKRILKYEVGQPVPLMARFLHAGLQRGKYMMWFEVDDRYPGGEDVRHQLVATGVGLIPADGIYRGTIIDNETDTVWHVYELP